MGIIGAPTVPCHDLLGLHCSLNLGTLAAELGDSGRFGIPQLCRDGDWLSSFSGGMTFCHTAAPIFSRMEMVPSKSTGVNAFKAVVREPS